MGKRDDSLKKIYLFFCILLLALGIYFYPVWKHHVPFLQWIPITEENSISSIKELEEIVIQDLKQGKKEHSLYISKSLVEKMKNINENLDGYYGHVKSYHSSKITLKERVQVKLKYQLSDNYYAYEYLKNGLDIKKQKNALLLAKKAQSIIKKIIKPNMTDYEKEKAIHDYIVKNGTYGFIKGKQKGWSYESKGILLKGKGVCSSYAEAMQLLLSLVDVESKIVIGKADIDHSWNLVKINKMWYHVDTTWDDPVPDKKDRVLYHYFNIPDKWIEKSHEWKREYYEPATSYEENYYVKQNLWCKNYEETKLKINQAVQNKENKITLFLTDRKAKKYTYNFILQQENVRSVRWKYSGESPCLLLEISVTYR